MSQNPPIPASTESFFSAFLKLLDIELREEEDTFIGNSTCCNRHSLLLSLIRRSFNTLVKYGAYEEDHVVKERRVRKIAQEFKAGRTVFKRSEGSGRPITVSNNYNVDIVREVIEEDSCVSLGIIGRATGLKRSSIQRIIHKLSLIHI